MGDNTTTTTQQGTAPFAQNQTVANSAQTVKDPYAASLPWLQTVAQGAQNNYSGNLPMNEVSWLGGYTTPYLTGQQYLNNTGGSGITSQMQTPLSQLAGVSSGANGIQTGNLYQQLFNQAQPLAGNISGALTDTQQAILNDNATRLGSRLASQYSGAGRYGSFGAGEGLARGIAETNNPLMAQYNQQNIGNALSAMGVQQGAATGLSNVQQQNIGNQMNAANAQLGAYNQGLQNIQRQEALQPALMPLAMSMSNAQNQELQNYAGALSSMYPMLSNAGSVTTNGNTTVNSQGFQGTNTTGTTSQPTPWTTYAGLGLAGIGAGTSLFSDRRLKTDIKKVGKDPWTNLSMYQWRYKGQPKNTTKFIGPMAQDVQKKYPEAVGETESGILFLKKKVA